MNLVLSKRPQKSSSQELQKICKVSHVLTNIFNLKIQEQVQSQIEKKEDKNDQSHITCFQYDVEFQPEVSEDDRQLRYAIFKKARKDIERLIGKFSFSGKSFYSLIKPIKEKMYKEYLNFDSIKIGEQSYSMRIKFVKQIEVQNDETVDQFSNNQINQILNITFKDILREENFIEIGKNSKFYKENDIKERQITLKNGYDIQFQIYKGITFQIYQTLEKYQITLDFTSRIMRKDNALKYLKEFKNGIIGQSVITAYNNYQRYQITDLDRTKTPQSQFLWNQTNNQISFLDYYYYKYRIKIEHINQPLLVSFTKKRDPITKQYQKKIIYLVPELCLMAGLSSNEKRSINQITRGIQLNPKERYEYTIEESQLLRKQSSHQEVYIDSIPIQAKAYILNPPNIILKNSKIIPEQGKFDFKGQIFECKTDFTDWIIIYSNKNQTLVNKLLKLFQNITQKLEIKYEDPKIIHHSLVNPKHLIEKLDKYFIETEYLPSFIVTFGDLNTNFYQQIKHFFCILANVESQHISPQSLKNKNKYKICLNIVLQILQKTGNQIWNVEMPMQITSQTINTMIVGIETSRNIIKGKQIIAVVCSINRNFSRYLSQVYFREKGCKQLHQLQKIIKDGILIYQQIVKKLPKQIIIYKQGQGDDLKQNSHLTEIESIQNIASNISPTYSPKFAYFNVNKNVTQKIYQQNEDKAISNPIPGTVFSHETSKSQIHFYLIAQNCRNGVSIPTKYSLLYNSTDLNQETFWQFTYYQTFNYYNQQGSIRVPAALKYAEKLAKYVFDYLQDDNFGDLKKNLFYL
ncbi:piwi-like protein (macronuclear) [Tetrahymena thermophila SB210]|uniref:Piwi-like protein n=2 Tax=Tetrahymena thermophila TaxID=5911 RepID=Q22NE2_TETTS|nr:piwi-like protein [Tetrahymena thermophila SB210]ABW36050.1 PIWI-like Twi9p [Tetrahymena thermophila]EAR86843.2 piwi-like protein [Tetrahymena thermophila SB210]|eukprot:XP_001007088.2 piwi-like protein [Tetrahymena thermophila SB210]